MLTKEVLQGLITSYSLQHVVEAIAAYCSEQFADTQDPLEYKYLLALNKLVTDVNYNIINGYPAIPLPVGFQLFKILDTVDYTDVIKDISAYLEENRLIERNNSLMGGCFPRTDIYLDALVDCYNSLMIARANHRV